MVSAISLGFPALAQTAGPDLTIKRINSGAVFTGAPHGVALVIANHGNATAAAVSLSYAPAQPTLQPISPPGGISAVLKGHSGRGGGYTRVGSAFTPTTVVNLAPGASTVFKFDVTYGAGTYPEVWTAQTTTAELNLVTHTVSDTVIASLPPVPSSPTILSVGQTGDSLLVKWQLPTTGNAAITSSTVTATPTNSALPTLTASVAGRGNVVEVPGVEPQTTYSVTVTSYDAAGASPVSLLVSFITHVSIVPPSPPTALHTWWIPSGVAVGWTASVPGDSPVDDYQISGVGQDGGGTVTIDSPTSTATLTEAVLPVPYLGQGWQIMIRAHNQAGWGKWSAPVTQGAD